MRNYGQLVDRLVEEVDGLKREDGERLINRAYRTAVEANAWSHLIKRFTIQTEPSYDTGTIAVTEAGTGATLTGGAWVTSWVTAPSMRRIRVQGRTEVYDVTAMGSTTTATLGDPFLGETNAAATYFMYRDVYPLPADCNMSRLLVLYDPVNGRRLHYYNQPEFLMQRNNHGGDGTLGTPECFMLIAHTAETPPRAQIEMFPASDVAEVFHGWYFRRPAFMAAAADYPDWPAEFEDVLWLGAAIDYYQQPRHFTPQYLSVLEPKYKMLWTRMKREMDGNTAIDRQIKEIGIGGGFTAGWKPNWRVG
jgi:hypothetical protein